LIPSHLSIEITQRCSKGCAFCYASSTPAGDPGWTADELLRFATDVTAAGVQSISLGGGEPLEHPEWREILDGLRPLLPRTLTTNGLPLDAGAFDDLVAAAPDKVHLSIHNPGWDGEVSRVIRQVLALESAGIPSGVNLVVRRSTLEACAAVVRRLAEVGVGLDRIVLLPLRGSGADVADTPGAKEIAAVAGSRQFRATSCLTSCQASPRFASIGWDKTVALCSYTTSRRPMATLDAAGLAAAVEGLGLTPCAVLSRNAVA